MDTFYIIKLYLKCLPSKLSLTFTEKQEVILIFFKLELKLLPKRREFLVLSRLHLKLNSMKSIHVDKDKTAIWHSLFETFKDIFRCVKEKVRVHSTVLKHVLK